MSPVRMVYGNEAFKTSEKQFFEYIKSIVLDAQLNRKIVQTFYY